MGAGWTKIRETASARLPAPEEATALRIGPAQAVPSITSVALDTTGRVTEAALPALTWSSPPVPQPGEGRRTDDAPRRTAVPPLVRPRGKTVLPEHRRQPQPPVPSG
ncbi:UTRA domain-containing protein [Streptomyces tamarix]|uniref:UTRA domain-containing protein n=1 Tax=Streptomyces tamarix TaxID=3078565 RepID=UPI003704049B